MESASTSDLVSPHSFDTSGFNTQAKMLINNVISFLRQAKRNSLLLKGSPIYLASRALNISLNTVSRISSSAKKGEEFTSPKRKKPHRKSKIDLFDSFDIQGVRNVVKSFYSVDK